MPFTMARPKPIPRYYNPWTDTVHVYSDHPAVALHELGHAWDFGRRRFRGTYGLIRTLPVVPLYQEFIASDKAFDYFIEIHDQQAEEDAYKILVPAYGSYIGSYFLFPFNYVAVGIGHVWGRSAAAYQAHVYRKQDERQQHDEITLPAPAPAEPAQPEVAPSTPEPEAPAPADTPAEATSPAS